MTTLYKSAYDWDAFYQAVDSKLRENARAVSGAATLVKFRDWIDARLLTASIEEIQMFEAVIGSAAHEVLGDEHPRLEDFKAREDI